MIVPSILRLAREVTVVSLAAAFTAACASAPNEDSANAGASGDQVRVGYGTQDRAEVTGAVGSVTADDVSGQQVTRLEDLINGRFAGVYAERLPNGGISVRIRGSSTLMADGEPLFVIDGMPINPPAGSALLAVNPNEVARIDILKDAGAAAIYGSRGANGVVLITMKRAP